MACPHLLAALDWSRAHARLADGVTNPAQVDIMGIAKQTMDAALP